MAQTSRTKPQSQLEEPAALAVCHALLPVELGTLGFGLPLAVTSFSRYSWAVEALGRRYPSFPPRGLGVIEGQRSGSFRWPQCLYWVVVC